MTVATPPRSTSELGYVGTGSGTSRAGAWWASLEDEATPELRWPHSIDVFDDMERQDAQVRSVLRAVTLPVRRTPWRIEPAGARDEVVEFVAENLDLPISGNNDTAPVPSRRIRGRFSWPEHLRVALLHLQYGVMFFEQVYSIDDTGPARRSRLRKLAPRWHRTIDAIDVAPDGGLISIRQRPLTAGADPIVMPVSRLVAYVHEQQAGSWVGRSLLRPAYKNWVIKDRLLRVNAQLIERNGMGIPAYEAAEGETDLGPGLRIAQSLRSGDESGVSTPFGAKMRLIGVEGDLPDALAAIRYHDEQIARAVLAHFLNLGTQTGSWALGSTFADFFTLGLQAIADAVADVGTHHVVWDLVDVNWGEDEPAPRIVCDDIGGRLTADALRQLVDAGVLRPDRDLEEFIRDLFNLPAKPDAPITPPGTPGAAAGTGEGVPA